MCLWLANKFIRLILEGYTKKRVPINKLVYYGFILPLTLMVTSSSVLKSQILLITGLF